MKKFIALAACISVWIAGCHTLHNAQHSSDTIVKDISGNDMLLGKASIGSLSRAPFSEWYNKNYNEYEIKKDSIELLKPLLKKSKVTVFLGSWCGDSRREVPRMLKILSSSGTMEEDIELIMVSNYDDAYKLSPGNEQQGKYIFRVPTFIFSKDGKEIGRIIESPVTTLENDMLTLLRGDGYVPKYSAGMMMMKRITTESLDKLRSDEQQLLSALKPTLFHRSELSSIGYVLLAEKKNEEALFVLELNAKLYLADVSVYNALADAYWRTGDKNKARTSLEKAISINAENEFTVELRKKMMQ